MIKHFNSLLYQQVHTSDALWTDVAPDFQQLILKGKIEDMKTYT